VESREEKEGNSVGCSPARKMEERPQSGGQPPVDWPLGSNSGTACGGEARWQGRAAVDGENPST
jgi:hypothetical protein